MGKVADTIASPDWEKKTPLEKALMRKDMFVWSLDENPGLKQSMAEADENKRNEIYKEWNNKLNETFPDAFRTDGSVWVRTKGEEDKAGTWNERQARVPVYDIETEKFLASIDPRESKNLNNAREILSNIGIHKDEAKPIRVLLRSRFGDYANITKELQDKEIDDENWISVDKPTAWEKFINQAKQFTPALIRATGAVGGSTIGGIVGAPAAIPSLGGSSVAGAALGGATGAALVEYPAQYVEEILGQRKKFSVGEAAFNIGFAGIPGMTAPANVGRAVNMAFRAGEAMAISGAQNAGHQILFSNEPFDYRSFSKSVLYGAPIGALVGSLHGKTNAEASESLSEMLASGKLKPDEAIAAQKILEKLKLEAENIQQKVDENLKNFQENKVEPRVSRETKQEILTDTFNNLPPSKSAEESANVFNSPEAIADKINNERVNNEVVSNAISEYDKNLKSFQENKVYPGVLGDTKKELLTDTFNRIEKNALDSFYYHELGDISKKVDTEIKLDTELAAMDDMNMSPQARRMYDKYGFTRAPIIASLGGSGIGGVAGSAYGLTKGDTKEERLVNSLKFGASGALAGLAIGYSSSRLFGRNIPVLKSPDDAVSLVENIAREGGVQLKIKSLKDSMQIEEFGTFAPTKDPVATMTIGAVKKLSNENGKPVTVTALSKNPALQEDLESFYYKRGFEKVGHDPATGAPKFEYKPGLREYQYTVNPAQKLEDGTTIPGFVQVDEIFDGRSVRSSELNDLTKEGIHLPEVPEWMPAGRYSLSDIKDAILSGPPPDGQIPITIVGKDGKNYQAVFNGYYDLGDTVIPSVGRKTDTGWTHGSINEGEKVLSDLPTPEQWRARTAAKRGAIPVSTLSNIGGGAVGVAYGLTTGDTPRERAARAALFGVMGLGATSFASRFLRNSKGPSQYLKYAKEVEAGSENMPDWYLKLREVNGIANLRKNWYNEFSPIKDLVSNVYKQGGKTEVNPYASASLFRNKVYAKDSAAEKAALDISSNMDSVIEFYHKAGEGTRQEVGDLLQDYILAKHAPHYNAQNKAYELETGKPASGITDQQASEIIDTVDKKGMLPVFEDIRKQIKEYNDAALQVRVDSGLVSQQLADELRKKYPEYVSMNRVFDDTDDVVGALTSTPKFGARYSGLKSAKGSDREVHNFLESALANMKDAIVRSERNNVAIDSAKFFKENQVPGIEVSRVKPIGKDFSGKMIYPEPKNNELHFFEKGDDGKVIKSSIKFDDPLIAASLNGLGREQMGAFLSAVSKVTRGMSALYTKLKPEFQVGNKIRDTGNAVKEALTTGDIKAAGKTLINSFRDMKSVSDSIRGLDTPGASLYAEAEQAGAITGGIVSSSRDSARSVLQKRSPLMKPVASAMSLVDFIGDVSENSTKLTAYRVAREAGATKQQAAMVAKQASFDAGMKGRLTSQVGALKAFFNPGIQGSVRGVKSIIRNPRAIAEISTGLIGVGIAIDKWNKSIDPKWKDKEQNKYYRSHSIPILIPSSNADGGYFVTTLLSVPQELRGVKAGTDLLIDYASGDIKDIDRALSTVNSAVAQSLSPVSLGNNALQTAFSGTIASPFIDIATNISYSGSKIRNEPQPYAARYTAARRDILRNPMGEIAYSLSKSLYKMTNGNFDLAPEDLLYAFKATGGPGDLVSTAVNLIGKDKKGEIKPSDITSFIKYVPADARSSKEAEDPALTDAINDRQERNNLLKIQAWNNIKEITKTHPALRAEKYRKIIQENPEMEKAIEKEYARMKLRPSNSEIQRIQSLGKEDGSRAKYVYGMLMKADPNDRPEIFNQLKEEGVVDENVLEQLDYLYANQIEERKAEITREVKPKPQPKPEPVKEKTAPVKPGKIEIYRDSNGKISEAKMPGQKNLSIKLKRNEKGAIVGAEIQE